MTKEKAYRAAPLSAREQERIRAGYRKGDCFRGAEALSERYSVPPEDIIAVVNFTYTKGKRNNAK